MKLVRLSSLLCASLAIACSAPDPAFSGGSHRTGADAGAPSHGSSGGATSSGSGGTGGSSSGGSSSGGSSSGGSSSSGSSSGGLSGTGLPPSDAGDVPIDDDAALDTAVFGQACTTKIDCNNAEFNQCEPLGVQQQLGCTKPCVDGTDCEAPPTHGICDTNGYCE